MSNISNNTIITSSIPRLKEQFAAFYYYPGIVLIFEKNNRVVFQNKLILGKANIVNQTLKDILKFVDNKRLLKDCNNVWDTGNAIKTTLVNPINQKLIDIQLSKCEFENSFFLLAFIDNLNTVVSDNSKEINNAINVSQRVDLISKYRIIANSIADVFFILDKELNFSFISPSVERVLQYRYAELIGKGFDVLIPEWSGNTLKKNLETVLALKPDISSPQRFTIQLSGKYGSLNWYEVQISGLYTDKNELQGFNGVCRDITERLKYEEALRTAKKKAEESDQLKSAFLANMSHEIRTPLNGIIGFSSMLINKHLSKEKQELYADYIISSSKQLLTLISDIIDISKIEASQLSVVITSVDVNSLLLELSETIGFEKDRLQKNDIEITLKLPKNKQAFFNADEVRLKQVLINLLSNALKFTDEGSIEFGYSILEGNNNIRFYVKDSGTGIPESLQKAVFERFRQGMIDDKAKIVGTGLGLAISKGLIELMGGYIDVKSIEGEGSEFFFTLPYISESSDSLL